MASSESEVRIDGVIADAHKKAVLVRARFEAPGLDRKNPKELTREPESFLVKADDGRSITVTLAKGAVIGPKREISGPWKELKQHAIKPTGDFHPDGHLTIEGVWLAPGDRVRVIGEVTDHDFIKDTGGQREAPEEVVSAVRANAIGVGDDAQREAESANTAFHTPPPDPAAKRTMVDNARVLVWVLATAVVVLVGAQLGMRAGTLGTALSYSYVTLLLWWYTSRDLKEFPGGASEKGLVYEPGPFVAITGTLLVPAALLGFLIPDSELGKIGGGAAPLVFAGLMPIGMAMTSLGKPRAVAGKQILMPANNAKRAVITWGLLALWLGAAVSFGLHLAANLEHRR